MTSTTSLTYDEMRTNAQKIRDAEIKERVLAGIEILSEKVGPGWVDRVKVEELDLTSGYYCVLGQVFDSEEPSEEQWAKAAASPIRLDYYPEDPPNDGYSKGLAILDGALIESETGPIEHGFYVSREREEGYGYPQLQEAWEMVFGARV